MDLLSWSNAIEGDARVSIVPWTDGVAAVDYRYMQLAQASGAWTSGYLSTIAQSPANGSAQLGHEIDATHRVVAVGSRGPRVGYSALVLGDGAKALLGTVTSPAPSLSHFAYLQATLRVP